MASVLFLWFITASAGGGSQWIEETATLPRADRANAIAYYNGDIFIIGGNHYPRQLIKYNIEASAITTNIANEPAITTDIRCYGQGWVQQNEFLFMITVGTHLAVYNLNTNNMIEWDSTQQQLPQTVSASSCLAEHNNFLFVVGGKSGGNTDMDTTQIFNISGNQWLNPTPTLNQARKQMPCIVHPQTQKLYIFGGYAGSARVSSIEILSVNDMNNIGQEGWVEYPNMLTPARDGS
eukprot:100984_1